MFGGHETTAKSVENFLVLHSLNGDSHEFPQLTFALWELAKRRDFQEKLRVEINETLAKVKTRGDTDFTADDFERMPYLVAFTKVRRGRLFVSPIDGEVRSLHRKL